MIFRPLSSVVSETVSSSAEKSKPKSAGAAISTRHAVTMGQKELLFIESSGNELLVAYLHLHANKGYP
jgi:hypothetical protein